MLERVSINEGKMPFKCIVLTGRAVKMDYMVAGVVIVEPNHRLDTALYIESWPRSDTIISIVRWSGRESF